MPKLLTIEQYLGPKLNYQFEWPDPVPRRRIPIISDYWPKRWLMEYLMILKKRYYRRLKRLKDKAVKQ